MMFIEQTLFYTSMVYMMLNGLCKVWFVIILHMYNIDMGQENNYFHLPDPIFSKWSKLMGKHSIIVYPVCELSVLQTNIFVMTTLDDR